MNQYVCDRCGHRWQEKHVIRCAECGGQVVNVWSSAAEANAKAQALRISREYEAKAAT